MTKVTRKRKTTAFTIVISIEPAKRDKTAAMAWSIAVLITAFL
jgi:hypothetical protein